MKNIKILLLEGGCNEEHKVSLASGKQIKKSLLNLGIKHDSLLVNPKTFKKDLNKFSSDYVCFNALHGSFGEDGQIQKILDSAFYKYTHSDALSSYICFNKNLTKKLIKKKKILTPESFTIDYQNIKIDVLNDFFTNFGAFVLKPIKSGSSFGIKIFKDQKSIKYFIKNIKDNLKIYRNHNKILIEKYIKGRELTVTVIEKNDESVPIEVTEIINNNEFFDYQSKYSPGFSKHILPAQIPQHIYNKCKLDAKRIHDQVNCKGISRSDFIYADDKIYFLEINNQPGLTSLSLAPEQLEYKNFSFDELILNLIKCAK